MNKPYDLSDLHPIPRESLSDWVKRFAATMLAWANEVDDRLTAIETYEKLANSEGTPRPMGILDGQGNPK